MTKNALTLTPDKAKIFLKEVQEEIVKEEETAFKEFVKGVYRYTEQLKKEISDLQETINTFQNSINNASNGNWAELAEIKIPARFFSEETLRKHGNLSRGGDIQFTDLYKKYQGDTDEV